PRGRAGLPADLRILAELDRGRVRGPALLRTQRHDHRSHDEQIAAIAAYVRWRNTHAEPKTNFAPDSPIRQWTQYPAKAA
ncbi:hypothetical protein, partial [Streptomyces sp. NRRL F-5122]|uniref:hypothetical protein n=1 Tax=Streptomyces sp. NRRL F-5122 TaxID=1609098 RepID=UPI001F3EDD61